MKQFFGIILLMTAFISAVQGQTANKISKAEETLRRIEETRREAIKKGDMKTLDQIYADDFSGIVGNGQIFNKTQLFDIFKRNNPEIIFTTDEINVRIFGKTAIFTGRLTGRDAAGKTVGASRFTHFFVKRGPNWQCVAGQSTALPST